MTFRTLLAFYLRRHRTAFWVTLLGIVLHQILFLYLFRIIVDNPAKAAAINSAIPDFVFKLIGLPEFDLRLPRHFVGMYYLRLELRALLFVFGITVASNVVAGEVGRGTADLLFSHPVRRRAAVHAGAAAVFLHLLLVSLALCAGFAVGTRIFPMGRGQPALGDLVPSIASAASGAFVVLLYCLALSSFCRRRAQAVGWSVAIILVPLILKAISNMQAIPGPGSPVSWISGLFPEHWYRPHHVLWLPGRWTYWGTVWPLAIQGTIALAVATTAAERRDLAR
ncbi:MAG: ABC transporter permease subunit [Planctomycetota bacterium]